MEGRSGAGRYAVNQRGEIQREAMDNCHAAPKSPSFELPIRSRMHGVSNGFRDGYSYPSYIQHSTGATSFTALLCRTVSEPTSWRCSPDRTSGKGEWVRCHNCECSAAKSSYGDDRAAWQPPESLGRDREVDRHYSGDHSAQPSVDTVPSLPRTLEMGVGVLELQRGSNTDARSRSRSRFDCRHLFGVATTADKYLACVAATASPHRCFSADGGGAASEAAPQVVSMQVWSSQGCR